MGWERRAGGWLYALLRELTRIAVRVYFHRIDVHHRERLPAHGAVLVVANHPASLTDVLLLGLALPRRIHFLAHHGLFRPWPQAMLLRACGVLPVFRREDAPELRSRNDETFRACHALFDEGGVVLIFPEGRSAADREVLPLKTGAARLALAENARHPGRLVVVPIGLHFVDRAAFRSDVVVSVGRPEPLDAWASIGDFELAVRELTERLRVALARLVLHVPGREVAAFVRDLERLYLEDLRERLPQAPDLTLARGLAECIAWYRDRDPQRLYHVWRRVNAYRRRLAVLRLHDATLRAPTRPAARESLRLLVQGVIVTMAMLPGMVVNLVPYRITGAIATLVAPDPTRLAFARMVIGTIVFPLAYAAVAAWCRWGLGTSLTIAAIVLGASVPLGFLSLACAGWLRRERERLRLARLATTHRGTVARLRAERRRLIETLDQARDEYLAAIGVSPPALSTPERA